MKILLFLLVATLFGLGSGLSMYFSNRSDEKRKVFLNRIVDSSRLRVDDESWQALDAYARRRLSWGAVGVGLGSTIALAAGTPVFYRSPAANGVLTFLMWSVGLHIGQALAGPLRAVASHDGALVSSMQPHGFRDYLRRRELAAQALCGLSALVATVVSAILLATSTGSQDTALAGLLFGSLAMIVWILATGLQLVLLRAPARAPNPSLLVSRDVQLASSLHDLVGVSLAAAVLCGYAFLIWYDVSLVLSVSCVLVAGAIMRLVLKAGIDSETAPVAYELAGRSVAR